MLATYCHELQNIVVDLLDESGQVLPGHKLTELTAPALCPKAWSSLVSSHPAVMHRQKVGIRMVIATTLSQIRVAVEERKAYLIHTRGSDYTFYRVAVGHGVTQSLENQ